MVLYLFLNHLHPPIHQHAQLVDDVRVFLQEPDATSGIRGGTVKLHHAKLVKPGQLVVESAIRNINQALLGVAKQLVGQDGVRLIISIHERREDRQRQGRHTPHLCTANEEFGAEGLFDHLQHNLGDFCVVQQEWSVVRLVPLLGIEEDVELQVASGSEQVFPQLLPWCSVHKVSVLEEELPCLLHPA